MKWQLFYEDHDQQYMQDDLPEEALYDAVGCLDGYRCTLISLDSELGSLLAGGGEEDKIVVGFIPSDDTLPSMMLVSDATQSQTEEFELIVGRQAGPYPAWMIVSPEQALEALLLFYRERRIPSGNRWKADW
jgi:hypothetical protein